MKTSKILVCCHKQDPAIQKNDIYEPIQVGKALNNNNLGFICDDSGDNISIKNPSYCELTALYWCWKNMEKVDYIGIAHYRRYYDHSLSAEKIEKWLSKDGYDVITTKPWVHAWDLAQELSYYITPEYFYILTDTIVMMHPEYNNSIAIYFSQNKIIPFNMFVSSWEWMQEYCGWLFPILEKVEQRIKELPYARQRRALGYMGEFLLGLYLTHNNCKVKQLYVSDEKGKPLFKNFYFTRTAYKRDIAFRLCHQGIIFPSLKRVIKQSLGKKGYMPLLRVLPAAIVGLKNDGVKLENIEKIPQCAN